MGFLVEWATAAVWYVPHQIPTIQGAIQQAVSGDTLVVDEEVYHESIHFLGKNITITGKNPDDWGVISRTILQAPAGYNGPVVEFDGSELPSCSLVGITIQNGRESGIRGNGTFAAISRCWIRNNSSQYAGGIHAVQGLIDRCRVTGNTGQNVGGIGTCKGIISNCLVADNLGTYYAGGMYNCPGSIVHCTIVNNKSLNGIGGMNNCTGAIANCIIRGNTAYDDNQQIIISEKAYSSKPFNSCISGAPAENGNISHDPLLGPDYSLLAGSPCIDTGLNMPPVPLSATDLRGASRVVEGDGNWPAVTDMGAIEFDPAGIDLATNPDRLDFGGAGGRVWTAMKTIELYNLDGYSGNWQLDSSECEWIAAEPMSGTLGQSAQEISIRVDSTGLAEGEYRCDLNIVVGGTIGRVVPVVLHVGAVVRVPQDFKQIQSAISAARDWDAIVVSSGTYKENLDFLGKTVLFRSEDPQNWDTVKATILDGRNSGSCIVFDQGEGNDSIVEGLTVQLGTGIFGSRYFSGTAGGGIYCLDSSPTIRRCQIAWNGYGNRKPWENPGFSVANQYGGGIALLGNCQAQIEDCLLLGNGASSRGAGVFAYPNPGREAYARSRIERCTFVENYSYSSNVTFQHTFSIEGCNTQLQIRNSICRDGYIQTADPDQVQYSCIHRFYRGIKTNDLVRVDITGMNGNIDIDPRFVMPFHFSRPTLFDLRLQSGSPCINHGDLGFSGVGVSDIDGKKRVMVGRLDMGAFEFVPQTRVISPAQGDIWGVGSRHRVAWTEPLVEGPVISNSGFESSYFDFNNQIYVTTNDIDVVGWTIGPESGTIYMPEKFDSIPNPDGKVTAFDRGSGVYQLLVDAYRPNCRYMLKLFVGNRRDSAAVTNWQAALTAGDRTTIAAVITQEQFGIPAPGKWIEATLTLETEVVGADANVGQRIGILLTGAPRADFDEVSLEVEDLAPTADVELSDDDGQNWRPIAEDLSDTDSFLWTIPSDTVSEYCRIRAVSNRPDFAAVPSEPFMIRAACETPLTGDIDLDCHVGPEDLVRLAGLWMEMGCTETEWCRGADLTRDGRVDIEDLAAVGTEWMK